MNYLIRAWVPDGFEGVEYFHVQITPEQAEEILKLMDRWNQIYSEFTGLYNITLSDNGCLREVYSYMEISEHVKEDAEEEYIDLDEYPGIEKAERTGGVDLWSMTIRKDEISWSITCKHSGMEASCCSLPRKDIEEVLKSVPSHLMKSIASGETLPPEVAPNHSKGDS